MILHPGVFALLASSGLVAVLIVYGAWQGAVILRHWNLRSGSELQLRLERRTYLVSMIVSYVFLFQGVSFFLYVFTADSLCGLLSGAMCAAGTLHANAYGYPALGFKTVNLLVAGVWLVLNHTDNRAPDYPLVRVRYWLLAAAAPLFLAEAVLQALYFLNLRPDVITSCCGTLFSDAGQGLAADLAAFPLGPARVVFFASTAVTAASGARLALTGRGDYVFGAVSAVNFAIGAAALLSFISVYVYELPTHHCPFCILQAGYNYVGYPLYGTLLGAAVCGLGAGALAPFRGIPSLAAELPQTQKRLAAASTTLALVFAAIAAWHLVFTDFRP